MNYTWQEMTILESQRRIRIPSAKDLDLPSVKPGPDKKFKRRFRLYARMLTNQGG